jgi:hypothetical protein
MHIKMLKTEKGSVDGIAVKEYIEAQEYALNATPREMELARAFVKANMAVEVPAKKLAVAASVAPVEPIPAAADDGELVSSAVVHPVETGDQAANGTDAAADQAASVDMSVPVVQKAAGKKKTAGSVGK